MAKKKVTKNKTVKAKTKLVSLWNLKEGIEYNAVLKGKQLNRTFKLIDGALYNNTGNGFDNVCTYAPVDAKFKPVPGQKRVSGARASGAVRKSDQVFGRSYRVTDMKDGKLYDYYGMRLTKKGDKIFEVKGSGTLVPLSDYNATLDQAFEFRGTLK